MNELDNANTESTTIVPNDGVTENLTPENLAFYFSERKDDELEPEKKKKKSASAEKNVDSKLDIRNYIGHSFLLTSYKKLAFPAKRIKKEEIQCS